MKIQHYSSKGVKTKLSSLPKAMIVKVNDELLAQAFHVCRARSHNGAHKTKIRGEINLTTAKWYKQKGTGRARHGSQTANIFRGGAKAHGPNGLKRELKLGKSHKNKALLSALNFKASQGELVVVSNITDIKKTKDATNLLSKVLGENTKRSTLVLSKNSKDVWKAFRNIKYCEFALDSNLNTYDVLLGGTFVIEDIALKNLEKKLA